MDELVSNGWNYNMNYEELFDWTQIFAIQNKVLSELNRDHSLNVILSDLTDMLDKLDDNYATTVLLNSPAGLIPTAGKRIPQEWGEIITPLTPGETVGSCGTAAYFRKTVIVENILEDPLWADFRDYQHVHGFMACWSQPIITNNKLIGTFAIYFKEPRTPSMVELELVKSLAVSIGIIVEKKQSDDEVQRLQLELEKLSYIDGLTGIPNRRMFDQNFEKEWLRAQREQSELSLIMIDIDFFKKFNDYYGHLEGDECLKKVGKCIDNIVNRSTDVVARYGGEEFIILLPNTNIEQAITIAEECRLGIEKLKILHAESSVSDFVTISVGASTIVPEPTITSLALIETADKALYTVKESGRNTVKHLAAYS